MTESLTLIPVHVIGGLVGIVAGFVALFALKGGRLHRKSGMVFVVAMLTMSVSGVVLAALKPSWGTALGGFLTFYLVTTGLLTTRHPAGRSWWMDLSALLLAVLLGVTCLTFGLEALSSPSGSKDGYPAPMYFVFGTVTWLAAFGDARMLARGVRGARRIARHVWRMSFAMLMATASFFLGQAKVIPKPIRITPLLSMPVLLVVIVMIYWLARLRFAGRYPVARVDAREPEPLPVRGAA